jgi:hypothetical protein
MQLEVRSHTHDHARARTHRHARTHTHTHTHTRTGHAPRGALQRLRMRPEPFDICALSARPNACARASALVFVRVGTRVRVCIRVHAGVRIVSDHAIL